MYIYLEIILISSNHNGKVHTAKEANINSITFSLVFSIPQKCVWVASLNSHYIKKKVHPCESWYYCSIAWLIAWLKQWEDLANLAVSVVYVN